MFQYMKETEYLYNFSHQHFEKISRNMSNRLYRERERKMKRKKKQKKALTNCSDSW